MHYQNIYGFYLQRELCMNPHHRMFRIGQMGPALAENSTKNRRLFVNVILCIWSHHIPYSSQSYFWVVSLKGVSLRLMRRSIEIPIKKFCHWQFDFWPTNLTRISFHLTSLPNVGMSVHSTRTEESSNTQIIWKLSCPRLTWGVKEKPRSI